MLVDVNVVAFLKYTKAALEQWFPCGESRLLALTHETLSEYANGVSNLLIIGPPKNWPEIK